MKRGYILLILLLIFILSSCSNTCTVTFDTNGGSIVESIEIKKGRKIEKPLDPIKEGYIFLEWYLDNKPFDFDSVITKDLTLVATWKENKINLDAPLNIKYENNTLSWDKVENATSYLVYINNIPQEVLNNQLEINIEDTPLLSIYIVSKNGSSISIDSEPILIKKEYDIDYIYIVLNQEFSKDEITNKYDYYNSVVTYINAFNIPYVELLNIHSNTDLLNYVEDNKLINLITEYLLIYNKTTKEENTNQDINNTYLTEIQELYNLMNEYNKIETNYENVIDDKKFMYFTLPYIFGKNYYSPTKLLNDYDIHNFITNLYNTYYNFNYLITKNNLNYTFTNTLLNVEFTYTIEEVRNILNFIYNKCTSTNSSQSDLPLKQEYLEIVKYQKDYLYRIEKEQFNININNFVNIEETKIIYNYYKNKDTLNSVVNDIYDSYNTILDYYQKFIDLKEEYPLANTTHQEALLEDAKNFSYQVAELVKDTIPNNEEIILLNEYLKSSILLLDFADINNSTINSLINNIDDSILLIDGLLNETVTYINIFADMVEELSVEDIKTILEYTNNDELLEQEVSIKYLVKFIKEVLNNSLEDDIYSYHSFNIIKEEFLKQISDFNLLLNTTLTKEEYIMFETEIKEFIKYINNDNFINTYSLYLIESFKEKLNVENYLNLKNQLCSYVIDYLSEKHYDIYQRYFISYLEQDNASKIIAENVYNVLLTNIDASKDIIKMYYMLNEITDLKTKDGLYLSEYAGLKYVLDLAKTNLNTNKMQKIDLFLDELSKVKFNIRNPLNKESLLVTDFDSAINILINAYGKQEFELKEEELQVVLDAKNLLYWYYPNIFNISINEQNNKLIIKENNNYEVDILSISTKYPYFYLLINGERKEISLRNKLIISKEEISISMDDILSGISNNIKIEDLQNTTELKIQLRFYINYELNGKEYKTNSYLELIDISLYYDELLNLIK